MKKKTSHSRSFMHIIRMIMIGVSSFMIIYYLFYYCTHHHTVRIYNQFNNQWHGWSIICNLDELAEKYPNMTPYIRPHDSKYGGDDIYWDDADGVYLFDEIYEYKRLSNCIAPLGCFPQPYLRSNKNGYMSHRLGSKLSKGLYYINQLDHQERRINFLDHIIPVNKYKSLFGFFVEIQDKGWRLARYELSLYNIDMINDKNESLYTYEVKNGSISPWLPFGKFRIYHKGKAKAFEIINFVIEIIP